VVADTATGWDAKTMTWDGTHPNPSGERQIARKVATALTSRGHQGLLEPGGPSANLLCRRVEDGERQMINRLAWRLNSRISEAAAATGVWSVGQAVYRKFEGHNACSSDEWIHAANGELGGKVMGVLDAKTMHPNDSGQIAYAIVFDSQLRSHAG
jgi:hypothetical protein